ncbi:hypothetical protein [Actibacterium sp. 188UL27-1]|nr:hypothetical protein [Actibacterium sp. 188UL27-1]MBM7066805.1 hypothetical protein [Actibacterium sp. 188UL27-1]
MSKLTVAAQQAAAALGASLTAAMERNASTASDLPATYALTGKEAVPAE